SGVGDGVADGDAVAAGGPDGADVTRTDGAGVGAGSQAAAASASVASATAKRVPPGIVQSYEPMPSSPSAPPATLDDPEATTLVAAADRALAAFIERAGPYAPRHGDGDPFASLARAIVFQQLATRAAAAI